jgi:Family of unknown function (DUF6166)
MEESVKHVKYIGHIINEPGPRGTIDVDRTITRVQEGWNDYNLDLRLDLANHSPTGFCWGYNGSGPAQTALAILADYSGDDQTALRLYQQFKWAVISQLPMDSGFELTSEEIDKAILAIHMGRVGVGQL